MSSESFNVGDIVRLNSSADRLTVDKIDKGNVEGEIVCIWLDTDVHLQSAHFHAEQLVKLPRAKGGA